MKPIEKVLAVFGLASGVSITALWGVFLATGFLVLDGPGKVFLLIAEILTVGASVAAGVGILRRAPWGRRLIRVALGMLLYAVVNGLGEFLHRGVISLVVLFALVGAATLVVLAVDVLGGECRTEVG